MSQSASDATRPRSTRAPAVVLALLTAAVLALTPSLVLLGEGSSAVSVAVVGLLVAAPTPTAGRGLVLLPAVGLARPATGRTLPAPPSHVTDPVHPRRPGLPDTADASAPASSDPSRSPTVSVLDPLSHALAAALAGAHPDHHLGLDPDAGPGWVLSLVAVVVVVRLCVLPLSWHGVRLAHANARARPHLQELTQRYRGRRDPESMREMMAERRAISAEHGVSRWGCLPLLVQLPVWFALYHLLSRAAAGRPFGLLDAGLVESFRNATIAGVPLADSGYLGAGPVHLAVVAGLAGAAAAISYVTQRVFVRQNTPPFAAPVADAEDDPARANEVAEAMARTQTLLPALSAGGMLLAGGVVPVALLVYWVASQLWTLGWTAAVWRFWPTPGTPAAARWAGVEPGGTGTGVSRR